MTTILSKEAIERAAEMLKKDEPLKGNTYSTAADQGRFDVGAYLQHYGIPFRLKNNGGGTLYLLDHCLFDPSHVRNESSIIQTAEGMLLYQCFHDSCQSRTWKEAREKISGTDSLGRFCSFPDHSAPGNKSLAQVDDGWSDPIPQDDYSLRP